MAAITKSAPVSAADLRVTSRIDADMAALTHAAPWLMPQGHYASDACAKIETTGKGEWVYPRSHQRWQCTRQVVGISGSPVRSQLERRVSTRT